MFKLQLFNIMLANLDDQYMASIEASMCISKVESRLYIGYCGASWDRMSALNNVHFGHR